MLQEAFFFTGIIIAVFLFLLLLIKRNKSKADQVLMIWMGFLALHQVLSYLESFELTYQNPHLLGLTLPLPLLHGVLLFFYVNEVTKTSLGNIFQKLLHFIPFVTLLLLAIPFYRLSAAQKIFVYENEGLGFEWFSLTQLVFIVGFGLMYMIWALLLIRRHRLKIQQEFSNTDKKNLQWLEYLSFGMGSIWGLTLFFDDSMIFSGVVVMVLFIGFFGINQLPIFYSTIELENPVQSQVTVKTAKQLTSGANQTPGLNKGRYSKSGLKPEDAERIYQELQTLMKEQKLFKDSELTLTALAKELDIHPNYLSQLINQNEKANFFHYINTLRVKEFIRVAALPESKNFTLLAIAFDCGFKSKSTFNKYFKQYTSKTPSEYFKV